MKKTTFGRWETAIHCMMGEELRGYEELQRELGDVVTINVVQVGR